MFTTILSILAIIILLVVLVVGGFFVLVYWRMIQRPVPKWDGDYPLGIFDDTVEVLRDKHGIPHIYAQNRADLFRAQGYIHAQDRLWQMEQNRRVARGTLAEVFGEPALEADRFSRIVGFWRAAEAELAELDSETRQIMDWYADGVNAYIESRPGLLAAEFNLLRLEPEPWSALDIVGFGKVMAWTLAVNWESELTRLRLAAQLDPYRAADLEPDYPKDNPIISEALDEETSERLLSTAGLLLNQYETLQSWMGDQGAPIFGVGQGSNSWAVAPKASISGRPMLANDPHLSLTMPGVFYENHLICPDLEVSGASFAGTPGVVIGHNEKIAWGFTNSFADVQDLFIERAHPEKENLFEFQGEWEEAQVIEEVIRVDKWSQPHVEKVVITRHGPIISGWLPEALQNQNPDVDSSRVQTVPLALQWVGHQPGQIMRAFIKINQATDWESFESALVDWSAPSQNIVYADVDGHIGYMLAGMIPQRDNNPGLVPGPGWTGEHEWNGMIPFEELPRVVNPESGRIVTANNKMVADDFPHFMGIEYYPGWRAARLEEMLSQKDRVSYRDMEEMQIDLHSKFAEALAPWMTEYRPRNLYDQTALNQLRDWNFRLEVDSIAATVFHYILLHMLEMTFGNKLGPVMPSYLGASLNPLFTINGFVLRAENRLLELIANHETSAWYTDAATGRERTRGELIEEAIDAAMHGLRKDYGESIIRWQWGRHHQVKYVHPMGSVRLLRSFFNRGPYPIAGDANTAFQTRHPTRLPLPLVQVVPAYRQVFDVGQWDRSQSVTCSGQSGHPLSKQYEDQIPMWREGAYHAMPWSRTEVEKYAEYRMTLR